MTVTQDLNAVFYIEESLLGPRKKILPRKEITDDGLEVAVGEGTPRTEGLAKKVIVARRTLRADG